MDFIKLAQNRYSVRSYAEKEVEEEKVQKILKAAQIAPTAKNCQPQKIYVLKSLEVLEKIRSVVRSAYNAPIVFLICADQDLSWRNPLEKDYDSGEMDASIVTAHMMFEAEELGLGSVWVRWYDPIQVAQIFNLPDNIKPICLLPVGYPALGSHPSPQHEASRTMEEMVVEL